MVHTRKAVLVSFADSHRLLAAKQMFVSAYRNGGWDGDYLLLTPKDTPDAELSWFYQKGVIVKKHDPPVYFGGLTGFPLTLYTIFYLFTPQYRQWSHVVFIDSDCIVRAGLDDLKKVRGFAAAPELSWMLLFRQFAWDDLMRSEASLSRQTGIAFNEYRLAYQILSWFYNMRALSFNVGVFAFNTDIITDEAFAELKKIFFHHGKISAFAFQGELNLFFHNNWQRLPPAYNSYIMHWQKYYGAALTQAEGIILHFAGWDKPWQRENTFYHEWQDNLAYADQVNFDVPLPAKKVWLAKELRRHYILIMYLYFIKLRIYYFLGLMGGVVHVVSPSLHRFLKRFVDKLV